MVYMWCSEMLEVLCALLFVVVTAVREAEEQAVAFRCSGLDGVFFFCITR